MFLTMALKHLDEDIDLALELSGNSENVILEEERVSAASNFLGKKLSLLVISMSFTPRLPPVWSDACFSRIARLPNLHLFHWLEYLCIHGFVNGTELKKIFFR